VQLWLQRVAFPTLSDEGALLASRALSQLLLTLPRLRVLALQLVEGEWSGGALVTDEVRSRKAGQGEEQGVG
jgi:hypothetical protein